MRILLTTHQFLPEFSAGTEVLTFEIACELKRRGHEVRILTGWPATPDSDARGTRHVDTYEVAGLTVDRIHQPAWSEMPPERRIRMEFDDDDVAGVFTRIAGTWRPDVVHCLHLQRLSASLVRCCVDLGVVVVFTATDFWAICPLNQLRLPDGGTCDGPREDSANCVTHLAFEGRRQSLAPLFRLVPDALVGTLIKVAPHNTTNRVIGAARALQDRPRRMREMLAQFDAIVAPTGNMVAHLVASGAPADHVHQLAYGVDLKPFETLTPIATTGPLRLAFVGTLGEHKGAHVLLEAVRSLDPSLPVDLAVYGDENAYPAYATQLRAIASDDPRIRFRGTFAREDFHRVLEACDVLVVPSTWSENTPLVMLAAQAAHRPVVGSDVPGIGEAIVDGDNGRLCAPGDVTALSRILDGMARDREAVVAMAARARAPKSVARHVDELETIYRDALARHPGRRQQRDPA